MHWSQSNAPIRQVLLQPCFCLLRAISRIPSRLLPLKLLRMCHRIPFPCLYLVRQQDPRASQRRLRQRTSPLPTLSRQPFLPRIHSLVGTAHQTLHRRQWGRHLLNLQHFPGQQISWRNRCGIFTHLTLSSYPPISSRSILTTYFGSRRVFSIIRVTSYAATALRSKIWMPLPVLYTLIARWTN